MIYEAFLVLRLWHDMCLKCHKCNSESYALTSVHYVFCCLLKAVWRVCTLFSYLK